MKISIIDIISSIGKNVKEPTVVKEFEDSGVLINELENISKATKNKEIQNDIARDIGFIKAGDQGERNVYYELINSFIPMLILHNVVIQYDDYKAQMDFIIITTKFICILETKKLNGNITINSDGDFVRSFTNKNGKVYKKEGMYSPISQNQRHVRILENLMRKEKMIKNTPVLSLVVIANPKSIINSKYTKKKIKQQIVKYDQLTPRIIKMMESNSKVDLATNVMLKMSKFLMANQIETENAFVKKYKDKLVDEDGTNHIEHFDDKSEVPLDKPSKDILISDEKSISKDVVRENLIKFRLDQSRKEKVKAYYIFNNRQIDMILEKMPKTREELLLCDGFGPVKVDKYGEQIIKIVIEN